MLIIKICYSARLRLYVNLFKVPVGIPLRPQRYNKNCTYARKWVFFGKLFAYLQYFRYLCTHNKQT